MNIGITKAIIAAAASIISAIITVLLKEYLEIRKQNYKKQSDERRRIISGTWKGTFEQTLNEKLVKLEIIMELKATSRGAITGKAKSSYKNDSFQVAIKGGFYSDDFLKMEYENVDRSVVQFGSFVFRLASNPKIMKGYFVGYGHISEMIISGPAVFYKI